MSAVLEKVEGAPVANETFSVTLRMDQDTAMQMRQSGGLVAVAESCVIDCAEMATVANTEMRNVIAFGKDLVARRKKFVEPAKEIIAQAEGLFGPSIDAAAKAEGIYKGKLAAWTTQEQERVAAERRAAEELARRLRQEAEQKAAAERARAEEKAREERRKAEEAETARLKAIAEGNARAAAAAAAAKARAEEAATAAVANGEAKAQETVLTAAAAVQPAPAQAPAVIQGFAMRKNWVAELAPGETEDSAKLKIVQAIATGRTDLLGMLALDLGAAGKLAKALEKQFNVPGLTARNNPIATSRKG